MPAHGWLGLVVIGVAEALLWLGDPVVGRWFTPIVWTGYIFFVDGLVFRLTRSSFLTTRRSEGVLVCLSSVGSWWLFEFYNAPRFWRGGADRQGLWWHYLNLEPDLWLRRVGYDWAFATIFPALFLTAELLRATLCSGFVNRRPLRLPGWLQPVSVALGAVAVLLPLLIVSPWLVPPVWVGYVLLLEPINDRRGAPSWLREAALGDHRTLVSLLASGLICGFLWEFWNYWALTKWIYTVPYWGEVKLFEMPVLGYLGFPPFACEAFAMYSFLRSLLRCSSAGFAGANQLGPRAAGGLPRGMARTRHARTAWGEVRKGGARPSE